MSVIVPLQFMVVAALATQDALAKAEPDAEAPKVRTYSRTVTPSRDGSTPTPAARSLEQQCEWLRLEMRKEARALNDWTDEKTWEFRVGDKPPVTITATVRGTKEPK